MRFRKAQAAMEFLMTYGWAILVVLVVIGALAYFGVLNPAKLIPDKCMATAGVTCAEYTVSTTTMKAKVVNGMGNTVKFDPATDIKFSSLDTTTCGTPTLVTTTAGIWTAGEAATLSTATTCTFTAGSKGRGTFTISYYTSDPLFKHDLSVDVSATVK